MIGLIDDLVNLSPFLACKLDLLNLAIPFISMIVPKAPLSTTQLVRPLSDHIGMPATVRVYLPQK